VRTGPLNDQGSHYAAFIEKELQHEYERRDSVNVRAGALIIGASGTIALTLLVGALLKGKDYIMGGFDAAALTVALAAFILSALIAILASLNWRYKVASIRTLRAMTQEHWLDDDLTALNQCAYINMLTTASLRSGTNVKYRLLLIAACFQLGALGSLSIIAIRLAL
jgi:hypothetical protein